MRWLVSVALSLAVVQSCSRDDGLSKNVQEARTKGAEKEKAEAERKAAEEEAHSKAAAEAERKAVEARRKLVVEQPKGNLSTTEDVAKTKAERAIVEELHKAGSHEKIAVKLGKEIDKLVPMLVRALAHHDENVRSQAIRILIQRKVHTDEVTAGWAAALQNEASDVVRENWGYDLRLYNQEKLEPTLLPAAHRAFGLATSGGAIGQLAEALMQLRYEPAVADVYAALEKTEDTMTKQYLLSAIKRWPREEARERVMPFLTDERELVRIRAKEVIEAIDAASAPAAEKK